jgi:hypothetical protein
MDAHLRVARPTDRLEVLGSFRDHEGFDGVMLGTSGMGHHFEFTHHHGHSVGKAPTQDNLLVFYLPVREEWEMRCQAMQAAGFKPVPSYNPYWDKSGRTFEDLDGYRVVIQNGDWSNG